MTCAFSGYPSENVTTPGKTKAFQASFRVNSSRRFRGFLFGCQHILYPPKSVTTPE